MLTLVVHAGLRVSELVGLNSGDVVFGTGAHVRCHGKGRKQRALPLIADAQAVLKAWLGERADRPTDPLFPTRTDRRLSRDAVEQRVGTHAKTAAIAAASLRGARSTASSRLSTAGVRPRARRASGRPTAHRLSSYIERRSACNHPATVAN